MTTVLYHEVFPTPAERLARRLALRFLRFRVRVRNLTRVTLHSKRRVKIVVLLFVLYSLSPLDFIPDFIPFVGAADELLLLGIVVWYCKRHDPAVAHALTHLLK